MESGSSLASEDILFTFNEQSAAKGGPTVKTIRYINDIVSNLYADTKIIRKGPKRLSHVEGINWRNKASDEQLSFSIVNLLQIIPRNVPICQIHDDVLEMQVPSKFKQDNKPFIKKVLLQRNGQWRLTIDDQPQDLSALEISSSYTFTKTEILDIISLVDKIRLCQGKEYFGNVKIRTCSVHKISDDSSGTFKKIIRSPKCKTSLLFTHTGALACLTCRKITICSMEVASSSASSSASLNTAPTNITEDKLRQMLLLWIPNLKPTSLELIVSQFSNHKGKQNRWLDYQSTLQTCLRLWIRSKQSYRDLKASSGFDLPSESTLRRIKNAVPQVAGLDESQIAWMRREADKLGLGEFGRSGGLLVDEMAIQPGVELVRKGEYLEFSGFGDLGLVGDAMQHVRDGSMDRCVADHVLQITFQGLTSFMFPICHFPTKQVAAQQLYVLFWQAVKMLKLYGFNVLYCSTDGAQSNRTFMGKCLKYGEPDKMIGVSRGLPPVIFIMDVSHVIKKIRNSVLKSKLDGIRHLTLPSGKFVEWQVFIDAFLWDQKNPVALHRKLTKEHIFDILSNNSLKMRNHLAEDVLGSEMLHLLKCYSSSNPAAECQGAIEFLSQTSVLIDIFRDSKALHEETDSRIVELSSVLQFFKSWETWVLSQTHKTTKEKSQMLLTSQTMEDLYSCLIGFVELVKKVATEYPGSSVVPSNINSDAIENHFCQQRCLCHGANTNPTYSQYAKAQNSIILLQPAVSKKGNASATQMPTTPVAMNSLLSITEKEPAEAQDLHE